MVLGSFFGLSISQTQDVTVQATFTPAFSFNTSGATTVTFAFDQTSEYLSGISGTAGPKFEVDASTNWQMAVKSTTGDFHTSVPIDHLQCYVDIGGTSPQSTTPGTLTLSTTDQAIIQSGGTGNGGDKSENVFDVYFNFLNTGSGTPSELIDKNLNGLGTLSTTIQFTISSTP